MMRLKNYALLGGFALASACAVPPAVETPTQPLRVEAPSTPQAPSPTAPLFSTAQDWPDLPLTPGIWSYDAQQMNSQASFASFPNEASFVVRCNRARHEITLARQDAPAAAIMTIKTSSMMRAVPMAIQDFSPAYAVATLDVNDPTLDAIVFSRGRFAIELEGLPTLVLPAWPEPARVIEDCRE